MKEKIFSHLISATITFRMIVYCNSIFDGNIIFMGYRTKTENHGNSRVWQAPPRMEIPRRGWRYGYFLELQIKKTQWRGPKAVLGCQIWHKCQHFSAHYGYFFTLNPTKVPGYLESTQFRDEHPDNPGHKNALITWNGSVEEDLRLKSVA